MTNHPYKWSRWAAKGAGQEFAEWIAILIGALLAALNLWLVRPWWLAILSAIIAWLLGTAIIGAIWASVRRKIEKSEGIN